MKAKRKKSHLSSKTPKKAYFGGALAETSSTEKLLEIHIDSDLFNYCPLIWMFHSGTVNNKIIRLHVRVLKIVHADYKSLFVCF